MTQWSEVPFPVQVGGTKVTEGRISGPPSKVFPALRDLALETIALKEGPAKPRVTIEVDTDIHRKVGVIKGHSSTNGERIWLQDPQACYPETVKFDHLVAFRVLKVEVEIAT